MVKVVEGEASHALNTSEGEGVDGGGASQTQCMDLSGVTHMLYACEGVYRITLPHPPVHPASLVRPVSLVHPTSLVVLCLLRIPHLLHVPHLLHILHIAGSHSSTRN